MDLKRFQEIYKSCTTVNRASLSKRLSEANKQRQSFRNTLMMEKRNIPNGIISPIVTPLVTKKSSNKKPEKVIVAKDERKEKLLKWQQEKKKRLDKENKKKKPLFIVSHISYNDNLDKVYNEIKGKPIVKKSKEYTLIAPSASYIFKPPANIKPIEVKSSSNVDKKKVQQVKREVTTSTRVTRAQKQVVPASQKLEMMKCNCKECPSTSGLSKMAQRGKGSSVSSNCDSNNEEKEPSKKKTIKKYTKNNKTDRKTSKTYRRSPLIATQSDKSNACVPGPPDNENDCIKQIDLKDDGKQSSSSLSSDYPLSEVENTNSTDSETLPSQPVTPVNKNLPCVTYVSPFVTMSRGKVNARKEYQRRSEHGGSDKEKSTSPKAAAAYFYKLLNNQINRLQEMCKEWSTYKEEEKPAEEACDMINVAIGQTELLINKKFQQFKELIKMCETGNSEKPVQCLDLHGFWDMITIQISNLDKRFENLQRLKDNDWEEILPEVQAKQTVKPIRKGTKKASAKNASSVRAFIQERRKNAAKNQNAEEICMVSNQQPGESKPRTPKTKIDIQRASLMSSGNRRISSPGLTMLKVTRSAKSIGSVAVRTPLNNESINTPRSILKSQRSQRRSRSQARKSKAVLFKEDDSPKMSENQENNSNMLNISSVSPVSDKQPRRSRRLLEKQQDTE
ncbi:hypothetical protein ILUMI_06977 [Ignelater luminosus]|uniref:Disks large-associated protein 5 n=1 Tax=Ignelater luminosus TaxID=2038154 RepID=A0A8K0GC14_IGNLU|nr:hypothetical protein ILUMI_06977 [Ignelater luminosus]